MPVRDSDRVDAAIASALGRLVLQHAALEEVLRDAIRVNAVADKIAIDVLLSGTSFSSLIEKFGALYYELSGEHREEVRAICVKLREHNERRNQFIHSFWSTDEGTGDATRLKVSATSRRGLALHASGVTATEIEELVSRLHELGQKVWEFAIEVTFPVSTPLDTG